MNTKTDGISSGLVAVAWLAPSNYEWPSHFISMTEIRNGEPLVRLSDAEAIISAKDAEIEAARRSTDYWNTDYWKSEHLAGNQQLEQLTLYKNLADEYGLSVFADLKEQAEQIKELETEFAGCSELLDNAERIMEQQSVVLKLARDALLDAQSGMRYVKESYGDLYGVGFDRVDEKTSEALAAIDALKGE